MEPKIIIHGGFFSESSTSDATRKVKQDAMEQIVKKGYSYLQNHSAMETVVYVTSLLEDCDLFNAGLGSQIQSDGKIRLSASLMNGENRKFSGVINVENVKNPIQIAEKLMEHDDRVLSGIGALDFARNNGFNFFNPEIPQRRQEYLEKKNATGTGTVGCVALDKNGKLAVATSTGGKGFEMVGRVSDSCTTSGNYANEACAISCTGVGEDIVSSALASNICTRVLDGSSIEIAFQKSFAELKPFDGFAGAIGIDNHGNIFHQDSHPSMVYAAFDGKTLAAF